MAKSPYFHCNKTRLKFWQDWDLLPYKYKQMLEDQTYCPTEDDLKAAWELVQEEGSMNDLINRINCLNVKKKLSPEEARRERENEKRQREMEKQEKQRRRLGCMADFQTMRVYANNGKEKLLARLLTPEELQRKLYGDASQIRIINPGNRLVNRFAGYISPVKQSEAKKAKEQEMRKPPEKRITVSLAKALNNARKG
jgi:hypothetical protein